MRGERGERRQGVEKESGEELFLPLHVHSHVCKERKRFSPRASPCDGIFSVVRKIYTKEEDLEGRRKEIEKREEEEERKYFSPLRAHACEGKGRKEGEERRRKCASPYTSPRDGISRERDRQTDRQADRS